MIKKRLYSTLSILLGVSCIVLMIDLNKNIATRYLSSDGKTQALFRIVETLSYSYKYFFVLISLLSFAFAIIGKRKREKLFIVWIAILISIFSLIIIFIPIWKIMIK